MKYSIEKKERYAILTINEEKLMGARVPQLKSEFVLHFEAGAVTNLIIDLNEVKLIDTTGIKALLLADKLARQVKGAVVLINVNKHPMSMIETSKLDTHFKILSNVGDAEDYFLVNELSN